MQERTEKRCYKCGEVKPCAEFHKAQRNIDGLQSACKTCSAATARARYKADRERIQAHNIEWYHANKARNRARVKAWKEANPDAARAIMDRHFSKPGTREADRARSNAYRLANLDKIKARLAANPEKARDYANRRRARKMAAAIGKVDLKLLWIRQCGICALCNEPIDRDLPWPHPMSKSVDHIIPLSRGGAHSQQNLQWVHLVENLRKAARLPT